MSTMSYLSVTSQANKRKTWMKLLEVVMMPSTN